MPCRRSRAQTLRQGPNGYSPWKGPQEHEPSARTARIVRLVWSLAGRHPAWDQSAHVCVPAQVCAIGDADTQAALERRQENRIKIRRQTRAVP